jgi:AraC family transcriptional regulator, regulatory protein of adaptative response / methylated-DNA-[protein]-cysteine methyltransferase
MAPTTTPADPRWSAIVARDPNADGQFFYAVATTGVYCRPSCAARLPRPENVSFHPSTAAAEQAGFRACKRCTPDQSSLAERRSEQIAELCRYIENASEMPSLAQLAEHASLSPHHLHRLFKSATGVTPRAYAAAQHARRVRAQLPESPSVTAALYGAGYSSSRQFYAVASQRLGMTPSEYRAGAPQLEIRFAVGSCSLGQVLVAASERGVCSILLGDSAAVLASDLAARFPRARLLDGGAAFQQQLQSVIALVERPAGGLDLPLDVRGTAFQERVWQALRAVPAGVTTNYTELAHAIGAPRAVRAVAGACAANPLAIAIPCHRVLRSDGNLSGYRWGVERKRELLAREQAEVGGAKRPRSEVCGMAGGALQNSSRPRAG